MDWQSAVGAFAQKWLNKLARPSQIAGAGFLYLTPGLTDPVPAKPHKGKMLPGQDLKFLLLFFVCNGIMYKRIAI